MFAGGHSHAEDAYVNAASEEQDKLLNTKLNQFRAHQMKKPLKRGCCATVIIGRAVRGLAAALRFSR